jgi:hypothetical protein
MKSAGYRSPQLLAATLVALLITGCGGEAPAPEAPPSAPGGSAGDAAAAAERNREILQRKIDAGPVLRTPPEPPSELRQAAVDEFHAAQQAILGMDLVLGIERLEQAVALDPDFGEAWFQLGEARHLLALIRVSNDVDAEALALERDAVAALRAARQLLDRGSARTLDAFDLDAMRTETAAKLAELDPLPTDDREALARLRDLANEMASELPVLDEEDGEGDGQAPEVEAPGPSTV